MKNYIIDPSIIEKIRKLQKPGRPDILKELITLFSESTQDNMKILRAAAINEDLGTVAHIAHNIKSSAATLGALKLSQCCDELEQIGNGYLVVDRLQSAIQKAEAAYHEAAAQLKQLT